MERLSVIAVLFLFLGISSDSYGQDLKKWKQKLQEVLQINGEQNEGRSGGRGKLTGTGDTYDSATFQKKLKLVSQAKTARGQLDIHSMVECGISTM